MPSVPTAIEAHATSLADRTALEATANANFITFSAYAIENAQSQGLYSVTLTTFPYCNIVTLQAYYISLGFQVFYPHTRPAYYGGPSQLFGYFWDRYWLRNGTPPFLHNPVQMKIVWVIVPPV